MLRYRVAPFLAIVAVLAGCDRPFVPLDPPLIEIVSPDLSQVLVGDRVEIVLRITALRGVADVTIAGQQVSRGASADLFRDTLDLAAGLNAFPVQATGADGNVSVDTLFVVRLALESGITPTGDLPEPRAHHAAAATTDGAVIVAGGVGPDGLVHGDMYRLREVSAFTFDVTLAGTMATPRAAHSAHVLADGRVLLLGGLSRASANMATDFVAGAEIFDPATGISTRVPGTGEPILRSGHVAFLLEDAGRTFFYIVGGRGPLGEGVGTPSSVVIAELRGTPGQDTLVTLTPPGGAGVLESVTAPAGALLAVAGGLRAHVHGLYAPEALAVSTRLLFLPASGPYPFQVLEASLGAPQEPRDDAEATLVANSDLLLLSGGRTEAGASSSVMSVFADRAGRYFTVPPEAARLRVNRFGHSATLLPSGRIALVGGYSAAGTPIASTEVVYLE